ncbi:Succinate--CoA ligase [ADP-forming] subunit beta [Dissostichus eleginoides]|uniref:Succinate--CoA ligase [ADP-forming] subunit beta n=1 Tax=Dissostichus eleginoides TaxID=100907 RepID=A0AAD9CTB1_DISEL|nr:Succinate--CoA ligase [ADP-forming] subunit beta [Dissostichus eleginoides]
MFVVWKNGFLYTNGAPYHVDQLEDSLYVVEEASDKEKKKFPWLEENNIFPLEVSAPQSSLQSIHIAEVHF